jgi:hypothetical protein
MHSTTVRRQALELIHSGTSLRSVSMSTGITRSTLREWRDDPKKAQAARADFHSDGYRGMNRVRRVLADGDRWYEYPRYLFNNKSTDILGLCGQALDRLGVEWRFARPDVISVARRGAVARLDEFVGPKY